MTREEAIVWCDRLNNAWANADPEDDFPDLKYSDTLDQLFYLAGQALRQQEHFRDLTKKVEPLALEELRQMDGEPVWVQSPGVPEYGRWAIVEGVGENCLFLHDDFTCHDYGKTWLAYRQKPEEDKHEQ